MISVLATLGFAAESAGAIVGGTAVASDAHPYFVTVVDSFGNGCGGSVIDADVVLTAAHCVASSVSDPSHVTVRVHDTTPVNAVGVTVHPLWNDDFGDGHDLAVIWLPSGSTAGLDPIVVGAPLDASASAPGNEATAIGHGATYDGGAMTAELREVQIPIRSDADMSDIYDPWWWTDGWAEDLHIGAGSTNQTICYGDSGGPLMVQQLGRGQLPGRHQFHQEFSTTRCDTGAPVPDPVPAPLPTHCRPPNRNTCQEQ